MNKRIILVGEKKKTDFTEILQRNYTVEWREDIDRKEDNVYYYIIMSEIATLSGIQRDKMIKAGIPAGDILEYCYFIQDPSRSNVEIFQTERIYNEYDGFWFGMSHSYSGLHEELIRGKKIYKFSAPSMDLFYHYQTLKYLEKIYDFQKIQNIYFELPYYCFNYDISMCPDIFLQRINFFYFFQEFHHFDETEKGRYQIYNFRKLNELTFYFFYKNYLMIDNKIINSSSKYHFDRFKKKLYYTLQSKKAHYWTYEEKTKVNQLHPHVWYKKHENTIYENTVIWRNILQLLQKYEWINVQVVVFPFCPYFINSHKKVITERKHEFIDNIILPSNRVVDMFETLENSPELFGDECHLNSRGAYCFTKILERRLNEK